MISILKCFLCHGFGSSLFKSKICFFRRISNGACFFPFKTSKIIVTYFQLTDKLNSGLQFLSRYFFLPVCFVFNLNNCFDPFALRKALTEFHLNSLCDMMVLCFDRQRNWTPGDESTAGKLVTFNSNTESFLAQCVVHSGKRRHYWNIKSTMFITMATMEQTISHSAVLSVKY